jgi:hypothetical protein
MSGGQYEQGQRKYYVAQPAAIPAIKDIEDVRILTA